MKCYISDSKNNRLIINCDSKKEGAIKFIVYFTRQTKKIGKYISVSEQGFDSQIDTESVFDQKDLEQDI